MDLRPHSNEWYDRLAQLQKGYFYPWKSTIGPGDGETAFVNLVEAHLAPTVDVLDVGCGHGDLALSLAARCRTITGYDRVGEFIRLATQAAQASGTANATFIHADSSPRANRGAARIPTESNAFDLVISRRGPLHGIADARRVCRPGAVLIQLNPACDGPPVWDGQLPPQIRLQERAVNVEETIRRSLRDAGLTLHSCWRFDVPEWFDDPQELYVRLAWGRDPQDIPPFQQVKQAIESVFAQHAGPRGLVLRHQRFLWKATATTSRL